MHRAPQQVKLLCWGTKRDKGLHLPFSGIQSKSISFSEPKNTGVLSFQKTMLVCFDTSASSQPVPGQMCLFEVPNMDFFVGLVEEYK